MIDQLDAGDVLLVTRLDRLARSTRDLLNTLAAISDRKAGFRSLSDAWADTTTAHGPLDADRTRRLGRCGARPDPHPHRGRQELSQGPRKADGPLAVTPAQQKEATRRRAQGATLDELARSYNVSRVTISRLALLTMSKVGATNMDRFKEHLAAQLRFIERSNQWFDAGDEAEAQRIAIAVRVICHQTGSSTSLLTHLGASNISILSTACSPVGPATLMAPSNLASLVITATDDGATFKSTAPLENAPIKRFIPFTDWWKTEVVCLTAGVRITRKFLVLAVANQDGGAHVDAMLKPDYTLIKSGAGLIATFQPAGGNPVEIPLESHSVATLRQIGYEVLHSPDLLALLS